MDINYILISLSISTILILVRRVVTLNTRVRKLTSNIEIQTKYGELMGAEKERRRFAAELHDSVGSMLSSLKLHLVTLAIPKEKGNYDAIDIVEEIIEEVRSLSHSLDTQKLVDRGLIGTLGNFEVLLSSYGKSKVNFFHHGSFDNLSYEYQINIYRIFQELLNNAIKYSQAENITYQVFNRDSELSLSVEDDGIGFDLENKHSGGIGLSNVEARVKYLGGSMTIDSAPNKGAIFLIRIPIND